jgi:uncharacterized membrane protein YgdD (TMEM256/DUF423 family)
MNARLFITLGTIFMFLAVALGAFAAHGLQASVSQHSLETWKTATQYQAYHALGLIALGIWSEPRPVSGWIKTAAGSLIAGIVLFSGSLYALVLTQQSILGMITPFGGFAFLIGWLSWMMATLKR